MGSAFMSVGRADLTRIEEERIRGGKSDFRYSPKYERVERSPKCKVFQPTPLRNVFSPHISEYKADLRPEYIKATEIPDQYSEMLSLVQSPTDKERELFYERREKNLKLAGRL
jgi:hypothetical protein